MSDTGRSEGDEEIEQDDRDGDSERSGLSPIESMVAGMENVVVPEKDREHEDEGD